MNSRIKSEFVFDIRELFFFNKLGITIINTTFINNTNRSSTIIDMSKIHKIVKNLAINEKNENFVFSKFSFNSFKFYFLVKGDYIACGIFSNTKSHVIKMYLLHMFIAFHNFIGDTSKNLKTVIHDNKNINSNEILHAKIFEVKLF
jgi:hypothetical protein